jgi:hypothetical protein
MPILGLTGWLAGEFFTHAKINTWKTMLEALLNGALANDNLAIGGVAFNNLSTAIKTKSYQRMDLPAPSWDNGGGVQGFITTAGVGGTVDTYLRDLSTWIPRENITITAIQARTQQAAQPPCLVQIFIDGADGDDTTGAQAASITTAATLANPPARTAVNIPVVAGQKVSVRASNLNGPGPRGLPAEVVLEYKGSLGT